jgi:hypothetical protein
MFAAYGLDLQWTSGVAGVGWVIDFLSGSEALRLIQKR